MERDLKDIIEAVRNTSYIASVSYCEMTFMYTISMKDPIDAANLIQNLTDNRDEEKVDAATILYLLGDTLNRFNSTDGEAQEEFTQVNTLLNEPLWLHSYSLKCSNRSK